MSESRVKTRFAPSPTGYLHIGGVRTALFSWAYARKHQGAFILRIEDTDIERSTPEAVEAILDGMRWLGLKSDNAPVYQSKRFPRYKAVINRLLASKKAYRCYCSHERLDKLREKQMQNKEKPRYDGHCRELAPDQQHPEKPYVIRFKNPLTGIVSWQDAVKGEIRIANTELDDFIIQRTDGTPTYNFCVVVDDMDMNITHIVRGDDHINNTPRQINLYHALNTPLPTFAHVPMILGEDGKKLSKRHGAASVMQYRDAGYLPQAVINYLIRLGWSYGDKEVFSITEILQHFDLKDINASASSLNKEKLNWLNQHYLRSLPTNEIEKHLLWHFKALGLSLENGPPLSELIPVMAEKAQTLKALAEQSQYFYREFKAFDEKAAQKHLTSKTLPALKLVREKLTVLSQENWQDELILQHTLKETAAALQIKMGKVGMPVRVAVTGVSQSPDIGITLKLIGKTRVLKRLDNAIDEISKKYKTKG